MVTDVTLALSVTPGAPATGLTRVGVDVEAPGRSAELWRPAGCCRRLHLGPWARHRARHACGAPSPHPLSTPLIDGFAAALHSVSGGRLNYAFAAERRGATRSALLAAWATYGLCEAGALTDARLLGGAGLCPT